MSLQSHIMTEIVRRRRDRTRKRAREPQEMITADNWTSIAWTNGNKRGNRSWRVCTHMTIEHIFSE